MLKGKVKGIYLRGEIYWFGKQINGRRSIVSLETRDYAEAVCPYSPWRPFCLKKPIPVQPRNPATGILGAGKGNPAWHVLTIHKHSKESADNVRTLYRAREEKE